MYPLAKVLIVAGIFVTGFGVILLLSPRIPLLGRLPGDVVIERRNIIILFPIATALIISSILTLIANLWFRR
jgi:hypothetical protein